MDTTRFPRDAPIHDVLRALQRLGFEEVRRGNHIALRRTGADGKAMPLTMPNHRVIKGSTLRTALAQAGCTRDKFLKAYHDSEE